MSLLASTPGFSEKSRLNFNFRLYSKFFVNVRNIMNNYRSHALILDEQTNLFNYFVL